MADSDSTRKNSGPGDNDGARDRARDSARESDGEVLTKRRVATKEPPMYRVVLLNDHYTTMEFVVQVLQLVFHKNATEAEAIMLSVHERGAGTAGVYTKEIAETKVVTVHQLAKENQYPLRCTIEPE